MNNENNSPEGVEKRLHNYFQKKAEDLKAPSDLWAKLESRLDEPEKIASSETQRRRVNSWFRGRRLIGVAASVAVVLLLLVTGLVWWTGDHGKGTPSTHPSQSYVASGSVGAAGPAGPAGPSGPQGSTGLPAGSTPSVGFGPEGGTITLGIPAPTVVPTPTEAPPAPAAPSIPGAGMASGGSYSATNGAGDILDTAQRQVISTASISLEVQAVDTAISQIQGIAESLGGFLEQMSSSGGEDAEQATVTIRVPQAQFFTAVDKLQALGKVQSQNVGTQDVTEQYIDLNARLKSAQEEEQSLLSLLDKTQTLSDIITLDQELTQVRSNIESIQGQLNYIERRVDLATIDVSLSTPAKEVGKAPSGSMTIEVHDVDATVATVKGLVSSVNGELDQVNISVNDGKETASLSLRVFRADFDRVMASIERQGKTRQKDVQEGITPNGAQTETTNKPDAPISLTLIETGTHGFWTSGNIKVVSITGGVVFAALLGFLYLAYRSGLLRKRPV